MLRILLPMVILFSGLTWSTGSQAEVQSTQSKIGLALSGGGARGVAHIGVIRELEKQNIRIDYIAGTSMGAIIGGFYASGMSIEQIEQTYQSIDWTDVLKDSPPRRELSMRRKFDQSVFQMDKKVGIKNGKVRVPAGMIRGQKLELELHRILMHVAEIKDFDQFVIPFRAIASDIVSNEVVVLGSGSLPQALRASMAVPGVFTPVIVDGRLLVDGGITNNLPIDIVKKMGADIVIAVDIGSPLLKMDETSSILTMAEQLTNILVRRTTDQQIDTLSDGDILITPELGQYSSVNFVDAASLIQNGEQATQAKVSRLVQLSAPDVVMSAQRAECPSCRPAIPMISYVRVDNDSKVDNEYLRQMLRQQTGQKFDVVMLEEDIGRIYGLGTFDSVQYELEKIGSETGLVLKVSEHPWGPNYLQFGLTLSSDFSRTNRFSIRFGYTEIPINSLNGEWRTVFSLGEEPGIETDLYQPLAVGSPWFIEPSAFAVNNKYNVFRERSIIAQTSVNRIGAAIALGREFSSHGNLKLGLRRYFGRTEVTIGNPDVPVQDINGGEIYLDTRHDTLDNFFFPRHGWNGDFNWTGSSTQLGADRDFEQASIRVFGANTWGKHTLHLGGSIMTTYDGIAPIYNSFRLGGLFNLPGYSLNELTGQNAALLKTGYLRSFKPLLSMPSYLGATLEYGDVFKNIDDIEFSDLQAAASIYLGLDSAVGPLFIGYGITESGEDRVYFTIGGFR